MTDQPGPAPYRPVKLPPFPADGIIPGATAEDVMGLALAAPCGSWHAIVDYATGTISYVLASGIPSSRSAST